MGNLFSTDNDVDETDERLKEDNSDQDGDFFRNTKSSPQHNRRKSRKQPSSDVSTAEIDHDAMQMPIFSDLSNFNYQNNDNEVTERKRPKTKRRRVSFRTTKSRGANRKY